MPCLRRRILPPPSSSAETRRPVYQVRRATDDYTLSSGREVRTRATNDFDCSGHITSFHSSFQGSGADHCNYGDEIVTTCFQRGCISLYYTDVQFEQSVHTMPNIRESIELCVKAKCSTAASSGICCYECRFQITWITDVEP